MRRALGLAASTQARSTPIHSTSATYGSHRQRHRFVRDGDVPVIFIRRNHQPDRKLDTSNRNDGKQVMQYRVIPQKGQLFSVEMTGFTGKCTLIPGFRDESEADAWIVQTKRMLHEPDPTDGVVARKTGKV